MIGKYPQELIRRSKATGKTERWLLKEDVLGLIDFQLEYCVLLSTEKRILNKLKARIKGR